MHFTCDREKLLAALDAASVMTPKHSPKPILENVHVNAMRDGVCRLTSTDLEISVAVYVDGVQCITSGAALLRPLEVVAILRDAPGEVVSLRVESDGSLQIWSEQWSFSLRSHYQADEFPDFPATPGEGGLELPAGRLRDLIRNTVRATDSECSRYALGGVQFEYGSEVLTCVASDGRRMHVMQRGAQCSPGYEWQDAIVPARALRVMRRVFGDGEERVRLHHSGGLRLLASGLNAKVCTRLLEGRFPKWRDVAEPAERENELRFRLRASAGELLAAIQRVQVLADLDRPAVELRFAHGLLTLTAGDDRGSGRVELTDELRPVEISTRLNPQFLADVLKPLDRQQPVSIAIKDKESVVVFDVGVGRCLLMPIHDDP